MAKDTQPSAFTRVKAGFSHFVKTEAELAKAEIMPAVKHASHGGIRLGAAAVFALHGLWMLLLAAVLAIGWLLDSVTNIGPWGSFTLAFLIVAVLSLALAGLLALMGVSRFKKIEKPTATIEEAKATMQAVSDALKGQSQDELAAQPATHGASVRDGGAHVITSAGAADTGATSVTQR